MSFRTTALAEPKPSPESAAASLGDRLMATRALSSELASPLSDEDQVVQAMDDTSPTKWHLAHTTWFFETFLLKPFLPGYRVFDERFEYLLQLVLRERRSASSTAQAWASDAPLGDEVRAYRAFVDEALVRLCDGELAGEAASLIELGINHEQQHQELLLTDILALFAAEPLKPAYRQTRPGIAVGETAPLDFVAFDGGIFAVGHEGDGFAFDNEGPRTRGAAPLVQVRQSLRHERRVDRIHRGRRLRHADALARRWLGHRQDTGVDWPALLRAGRWWLSPDEPRKAFARSTPPLR